MIRVFTAVLFAATLVSAGAAEAAMACFNSWSKERTSVEERIVECVGAMAAEPKRRERLEKSVRDAMAQSDDPEGIAALLTAAPTPGTRMWRRR